MKIKLNFLLVCSLLCNLICHAQQISIVAPNGISSDIANNLQSMTGAGIAVNLANHIGDITYTGINGTTPIGTNATGTIGSTVTISNTGSYTGTMSGGVNAGLSISGQISQSSSQTTTTTLTYSIHWEAKLINGYVWVTYTVTVGNENRTGVSDRPGAS